MKIVTKLLIEFSLMTIKFERWLLSLESAENSFLFNKVHNLIGKLRLLCVKTASNLE